MNPTYEAYDNFKKKHLAQNREIIHKNSELNKTNAELNRTITLLRAERLSLKGSHFQLECENASLRTKLERAETRERELLAQQTGADRSRWGGIDQEQVETMRRSLASAIATLQACGAVLPPTGEQQLSFVGSSPATPTPPTPASAASSSSASSVPPSNNVSVSRRRSLANRAMRETMTARPDLSYISEGGEGSTELDEGAESDRGWNGPVLEGLREESQPSQPSSSYSSPVVTAPLASTSKSVSPQHTDPTSPTIATLTLSSDRASSASAPLTKPPSKARAPPVAPSSIANQQNVERRPGRRVSGLVRPPPAAAALAAASASAPKSRGRGRSSMDIGSHEENGMLSKPSGKGKEKEREALVEVQPSVEFGRRRRVSRALSISSEDEDEEEPLDKLAALEDSSSGEEDGAVDPVSDEEREFVRPPTPSPPRPMRPPPSLSSGSTKFKKATAVAAETVVGVAAKPRARKVAELVAVREEPAAPRPSLSAAEGDASLAEPSEGRRARKSVNYALPKLNTKMRRPEDYVPVTGAAHTTHKPRKSTKAPSSSYSSSSALHSLPRSSSHTQLGGSERKSSAAGTPTPASHHYSDDESEGEAEVSFPKRMSSSKLVQEKAERGSVVAPKVGRRHSMAA